MEEHVTASNTGNRKEVNHLDFLTSLIVTVVGGVICHCIIKWLDSDKQSVTSLWICSAIKKRIENPRVAALGFSFVVESFGLPTSLCLMALQHMHSSFSICLLIIGYCSTADQIAKSVHRHVIYCCHGSPLISDYYMLSEIFS